MYQAELRGKLSRGIEETEDVLTSNVFGFFEYADREQFLRNYLVKLELDVSVEQARTARFEFWPTYSDGTEPDLVIRVGDYYILVEAKLYSDFYRDRSNPAMDQLNREWLGGSTLAAKLGVKFKLLTITAESYPKSVAYEELESNPDWIWSNWQFVALFLEETADTPMSGHLLSLLKRKGLVGFAGFARLSQVELAVDSSARIFYEPTKVRSGFSGFSTLKALVSRDSDSVFRTARMSK